MELRLIFLAIFALAVSQCSVSGHAVQRRQAIDDANYDDFVADEASDDEAQNDAEPDNSTGAPQPKKDPAVILTKPATFNTCLGTNILLPCEVSPKDETVLLWKQNNDAQITIGSMIMPDFTRYSITPHKGIQITNVQRNDSGVFTCTIMQANRTSIDHTLVVLEPPKIISKSATNSGEVAEDSGLTVTCTISAVPAPKVIWSVTKDVNNLNQRLTAKDGVFSVEGNVHSMYIDKIRWDQAGIYYCYANNTCGHDQGAIEVKVNRKPRVHVPRAVINSDIKVEAVLECSAHEAPMPHIRWYKDGVPIQESTPQFTISTSGAHSNLTVVPSTDNDFGTFTCEAENTVGKHNKSIDLVQRPVVENVMVDGSKLVWTVHSHQPLEEIELHLRNYTGNGEWKPISVPVPQGKGHKYEVTYVLDDSQIQAGQYEAIIKVKNNKDWGSSATTLVEIEEATPMYIQHASVFRTNSAHSIRSSAVVSTVLMYLLVRMM